MRVMSQLLFASSGRIIIAVAGFAIATATPSLANSIPTSPLEVIQGMELAQTPSVEEDTVESLPDAIAEAVFEDISRRRNLDTSELKILKVARQTWSDGCLGLGGDQICTQALVPGWLVIVGSEDKLWAYRTDEMGSVVALDETLSQKMTARYTATLIEEQRIRTRNRETTEITSGSTTRQTTQGTVDSRASQRQTNQTTQMSGGTTQQQQVAASGSQIRQTVQTSFTDIASNYWAQDFIAELVRLDIISGFPDGTFRPNEPVTRAQFAAMIRKAFEKTKIRNVSIRDVSSRHWAYNAIEEACETGFLTVNSANNFNPKQKLSRLEVLLALTQGLNYSVNGSATNILQFYNDASAIPVNVRSLVAAATQRGIVVNYPNVELLNPNQIATRAEVAAFLYQALVSTGETVAISSPYVAAIEFEEIENEVQESGVERQGEMGKPRRQNCNQGIGNGAEGCDPGNSRPHGGSNDEGGRTPGNR